MKLYHFTSRVHVEGCRCRGLRFGMVPVSLDPPRLLSGYQWLTSNGEKDQSWNQGSRLPYDRTEFRLTVRIPRHAEMRLLRWVEVADVLVTEDARKTLDEFGDPENWWLYAGVVWPGWIQRIERMRGVRIYG